MMFVIRILHSTCDEIPGVTASTSGDAIVLTSQEPNVTESSGGVSEAAIGSVIGVGVAVALVIVLVIITVVIVVLKRRASLKPEQAAATSSYANVIYRPGKYNCSEARYVRQDHLECSHSLCYISYTRVL